MCLISIRICEPCTFSTFQRLPFDLYLYGANRNQGFNAVTARNTKKKKRMSIGIMRTGATYLKSYGKVVGHMRTSTFTECIDPRQKVAI